MRETPDMRRVLFPEERGEPIARTLKELREHTHAIPEHPEDPDDIVIPEGKEKEEIYALTAYITERVHPEAEKKFVDDADQESNMLYIEGCVHAPAQFFKAVVTLEDIYENAFRDALKEWKQGAELDPQSYDARVRTRMNDLLLQTVIGNRAGGAADLEMVEPFIIRGAGTASRVSWNIMRAIPAAYYVKFGRTISKQEFMELAEQSEQLVIQLASLHIASFTNVSRFTKAGDRTHRKLNLEFPLELFMLEEKEGKLSLAFDPKSIAAYERFVTDPERDLSGPRDEKRLGCPARDARVGKESVVASIHRLHRDLAKKYIVPHLDVYTEGALDIATTPPQPLI